MSRSTQRAGRSLAWLCLTAILTATLPAASTAAAPEPQPVPTRWEFDFRPGPLRLIRLPVEGEGLEWFAFMTYTVANHSGQDRMLAPLFELATEEGHVIRSGRNVPPEVTEEIMDRLDDPLLQDQLSIVSTLLQGVENARRGLVVWRLPDLKADDLTIFAAGMSGESEPFFVTDPETGELVRHVLRKTRMLRYDMPGQVTKMNRPEPPLIEDRWILR